MQPEMLALLNKTISLMEGLGYLWVVVTGLELNLWNELTREQTLDDLMLKHPQWDRVLLDHWLEQAYCLDLLDKRSLKYRATKLGRAIEDYRSQGLEAMYKEFSYYWGPRFAQLTSLINQEETKKPLSTELEEELISRASLASEPFVLPFLLTKCQKEKWQSVLDLGCGEANYISHLLKAFPQLQCTGVELNPVVAERAAQQSLPYGGRLKIVCANALDLPPDLGSFDVCLLNNNIYYFEIDQRLSLLSNIRKFLRPGGKLGILTALRESDFSARVFRTYIPQNLMSFFLACHQGFSGLPTQAEITALLKHAGYTNIEVSALAMRTSHYFFAS